MKQRHYWLLALLSILTLMTTTTLVCAESVTKGHVEVGISGMDIDDNAARVNEYVETTDEDNPNVNPALKLGLDHFDEDVAADVSIDYKGSDSYDMNFGADIKRILRFKLDYQSMQHRKDHETLDQMGATARDDLSGAQPNVTTDKIYADLIEATGNPGASIGGANLLDPATGALAYDPEEAWEQELDNDYIVTRKELKSAVDLAIPDLPNIVFHAGLRIETREGMEQAVGLSKCGGCHVSASGKDIDERTEEYTMGATGKFGMFTVDYEFMTRDFTEQADNPSRWYITPAPDAAGLVKESSLLYDTGKFDYAKTPDSEKDTHKIKARADFSSKTSVSGSYVHSKVKSTKTDEPGIFELDDKTLESKYDGYNAKVATAFGDVRFSIRAGYYEIDGPEYSVTYDKRDDPPAFGRPQTHLMDNEQEYESSESREVTEFGIDAIYRIAKATTLRLGYEFEEVKRDEDELGETKTHTLKAAIKTRFNRKLSGRVSYMYQDIDDPFIAHNATGIAQGDPDYYDSNSGLAALDAAQFQGVDGNDNWVYYWNSVYPSRGFDATNQPDAVHEAKLSTTWAPQANMAATFYIRGRYEENDDVHYEQKTIVPGVSLWFAPTDKLNLTASYMYNYQDTENRACVGWYHG